MDLSGDHDMKYDIKYELNTSQSMSDDDMGDDDDSRDAALAIEENLMKEENPSDFSHEFSEKSVKFSDHIDIKEEPFSLDNEIILPGASFRQQTSIENREKKKEIVKSRKEIEEEEREKMQNLSISDSGSEPQAEDICEEELQKKCDEKLLTYKISPEKIKEISENSIGQHGNPIYDEYRSERLTASIFGHVCKRRIHTSCDALVKQCLYRTEFTNKYINYGKNNEIVAIKKFEEQTGLTVKPSGLFIDHEYGYLGASPDGIVDGEDSIIEVKCFLSLSEKKLNFVQAAQQIKHLCLEYSATSDSVSLKRTHNYFYQIQGQLHITKKDKCYFIIYIDDKSPLHIEEIKRDDEFWKKNMEEHLKRFFTTCILPEIILKRTDRKLKCRDPQWIKTEQDLKSATQALKTLKIKK